MTVSLWRQRDLTGITAGDLIPRRMNPKPTLRIDADKALQNSAVWACLRLRADMMSNFPVDTYRLVDGRQVEVPKPTVFVTPGGSRCRFKEWVYSTQVDLDRYGNAFGIINARDGNGLPAQIDLVSAGDVTVIVRKGILSKYRIGQVEYDPADVWHEKQYTVAGLPVGLSPIAFAAWDLAQYASIQQFALDWFTNGTLPAATLKNTQKIVPPKLAGEIKDVFRSTIANGDVFVHGADWEFSMLNAQAAGSNWLEGQNAALMDICRFFGCPADMIDVIVSGQSITYANMTTRNLQFLTLNLAPAISRREEAWSYGWLAQPRYAKLNTGALLRMDPQTQSIVLGQQLKDRMITPTEARAMYDLPPFTPAQLQEFIDVYGEPRVLSPVTKELAAGSAGLQPVVNVSVPERAVHVAAPNVNVQPADVRVLVEPADVHITVPRVDPAKIEMRKRVVRVGDLS